MALAFQKSSAPTIGVEIELQLLDPISKNLSPGAHHLLNLAGAYPDLQLKPELTLSMLEINTPICKTVPEASRNLQMQFKILQTLAEKANLQTAISGTHPFQNWRERITFPNERYQQIFEKFQWLARRWTVYGLHVHVGMESGDRAIHVMNTLIQYIPHLLALSASSPFWSSTDTGLVSSRAAILKSFPMGGLPYYFLDWRAFEQYYDTLMSTNAITSAKDIYWDIRPNFDFGTIEIRVCDGLPTWSETMALVALIQCLVVWIDDQYQRGKRKKQVSMQRYWLAPENKWQAIRYGLEGKIVREDGPLRCTIGEDVATLLTELKPVAQTLQCEDELASVHHILKYGPSATRQRAVFGKTHSYQKVVESLVDELSSFSLG